MSMFTHRHIRGQNQKSVDEYHRNVVEPDPVLVVVAVEVIIIDMRRDIRMASKLLKTVRHTIVRLAIMQ
jgi:hypothetical protein